MEKLYVLGGKQRKALIKDPSKEWHWYEIALILEVEPASGKVKTCVEYTTPAEARASDVASINFHSGTLIGDRLYTCTTTEILIFKIPEFEQVGYISLPCFNDLHHVALASDGNLLVVSTGLDMVVKVSPSGELLREWSVVQEDTWGRFSRDVDYRKVETTKPHKSHPNFVFELDGEVWVTRFYQRDAISLNGSGHRIDIALEKPHDGILWKDYIVFTVVDGKIILVNRHTRATERVIDLRRIQDRDQKKLPAWCRGVLPAAGDTMWVGFTRIRRTLFRENVRWAKQFLKEGTVVKPTHIALFDLAAEQCLQEIDLEPYGMNCIFGIFPVPANNAQVPYTPSTNPSERAQSSRFEK
jgi:hypothetical protein